MTSDVLNARVTELGRASRRLAWLSAAGILLILCAIGYAYHQLSSLQTRIDELNAQKAKLDGDIRRARESEQDILAAIGAMLSSADINIFNRDSIDWNAIQENVIKLQSGPRKSAVVGSLLLAWRDLEFRSGGAAINTGFDSPRFIADVLRRAGVPMPEEAPDAQYGPRFIAAMSRVDSTDVRPGDVIVYQYSEGDGLFHTVAFLYLAKGSPLGHGTGIGMPNSGAPVRVLDTMCIEKRTCGWAGSFVGYFRPPYEPVAKVGAADQREPGRPD